MSPLWIVCSVVVVDCANVSIASPAESRARSTRSNAALTQMGRSLIVPDFPLLAVNEFALGFSELATGVVLDVTFERWRRDAPKARFQKFSSAAEARTFARQVIAHRPNLECWLYDATGTPVERIEVDGTQVYPH